MDINVKGLFCVSQWLFCSTKYNAKQRRGAFTTIKIGGPKLMKPMGHVAFD